MTNVLATLVKQTAPAVAAAKTPAKTPAKKPAAKKAPAKKSAQPKTAKPAARVFNYRIITGRPGSGVSLYAFTQAWFELAGLDKGKAVSRKDAETAAGFTAINYHIKTGRMVEKDGKISLTAGGKIHFAKRADSIDADQVNAWKTLLKTGKGNAALHVSQACIEKVA